jgi:aryl-alcohol dehydrogenase-like predicted oxidoreductase
VNLPNRRGFGTMRIRDSAIVRRAVELGAGFLDTADVYGDGESERLIGEAFAGAWPAGIALGTKGGLDKHSDRLRNGTPEYLRSALDASLQRLRRDHVELYSLHRHDPEVPIEESVGALDELRREGKCLAIGVSNVNLDQLARARSVCEIAAVQNELNRGFLVSEPVLEECERAGISFMPWSPLGEGLRSPAQEIQWLLDRSPAIVPIPGTSSIEHLEQFWS